MMVQLEKRLKMTDDFDYSDVIGQSPIQMRDAEIFGPLQRKRRKKRKK